MKRSSTIDECEAVVHKTYDKYAPRYYRLVKRMAEGLNKEIKAAGIPVYDNVGNGYMASFESLFIEQRLLSLLHIGYVFSVERLHYPLGLHRERPIKEHAGYNMYGGRRKKK